MFVSFEQRKTKQSDARLERERKRELRMVQLQSFFPKIIIIVIIISIIIIIIIMAFRFCLFLKSHKANLNNCFPTGMLLDHLT